MSADDDLFELSPSMEVRMTVVGGHIPVLLIDNVYARPDDIREMALGLSYGPPDNLYPGRIATPPLSPSLSAVAQWVLRTANTQYLPKVPPIQGGGQRVTEFRGILTDFAIVDVHPDQLSTGQRLPHVDPVPVFGLVYLNREERGGTLFFQSSPAPTPEGGYITASTGGFTLLGRIEAAFNRMAIYPGFVPHSGEISGPWIEGEQRFASPRLTQRFVFLP